MATTVGTEDKLEELLVDLVQLDFDAAAAYQAAIDRLKDPNYRDNLVSFREDHLRHTRELGDILTAMGITPPAQGDMKQMLAKGKVVIGGLMGDRAILQAMRSNEEDTVTAYDRAVQHRDTPVETRTCLERNRHDEHRHADWMDMTIAAMK